MNETKETTTVKHSDAELHELSDKDLAQALVDSCIAYAANEDESDLDMLYVENVIFDRIDMDPNETEQGPTRKAVEAVEAFVSKHIERPWTYADAGLLGKDGTTR